MFPPPTSPSAARPRPRQLRAKALPAKLPPWGWLEWFLVIGAALPALLFVPGASSLRVIVRVASFVIPLIAWASVWQTGQRPPRGMAAYAPAPWLLACSIWLGLSIFHPTTNSLESGLAHAVMYISVLSPVFWVPAVLRSERQVSRLMMITFAGSAVSALMGIGQVYHPSTFNPPVIPALAPGNLYARGSVTYLASDGREIIRPCGLSDNPGQASSAGMVTCLIGLCLATRSIALWKRLICVALAFAGMADIYFSQIRTAMIMEFVCIFVVAGLFMARGHFRQAALLVVGIGVVLFGAAAWAVSAVGDVSTKRFMSLIEEKPDELYGRARGGFVQLTFDVLIWDYPLGAGMGRWGQSYGVFGDQSYEIQDTKGMIWVEVQWPGWVIDGGIPLMLGYVVAIVLAMMNSVQVVRTCKDRELTYWGAIICAMNLSIVATAFSQCPFIANSGGSFWLMAATLHAAGERERLFSRRQPAAPARRIAAR
jgi:hypothetical protein